MAGLAFGAAVAVLAGASSAWAEIVDITWDAGNRFERSLGVAPGKFAEACARLAKDDTVRWGFEASAPLDFNVHYHEGKAVVFPVKRDGADAARGTLRAELAQDYCWMWTNRSGHDVKLRILLSR